MSTAYTTKFQLDISKALAELKRFQKAKDKVLKSNNAKFKIDTTKAISEINKLSKLKKRSFESNPSKFKIDISKATKDIRNLKNISRNAGEQAGISFGKLFTANLSSFLTGSAIISVFNGLTGSITDFGKSVFDTFTDVDEQLANIQKTTGLTGEELDSLQSDVFKDIGRGTRTANKELLKIVETGGRLGISEKKDLIPFVKGINKINVALGDEFVGGGEEAVSVVGKLVGSFEELRSLPIDQSLDKIGSAINEVGSNSKGTGGNLANFIGRVGQLPDAIKPSVSSTVALGAVLEGADISAEIASGGITNLLLTASKNLPKFAKQMNIGAESAKNLLETDPGKFAVEFSKSLQGLSADELSSTLDNLKIGSQETIKTVGALGSRTDEYSKLQDIANGQIKDATSLTNEYNVKNKTARANIAKLSNRLNEGRLKIGEFGEAFLQNLPFLDKFSTRLVELTDSILDLDFKEAGANLGKNLSESLASIELDGLKNLSKDVKDIFKDVNVEGIKGVFDTIKKSLNDVDFDTLKKGFSEFAGNTLKLGFNQIKDFINVLTTLVTQVDVQTFFKAFGSTLEILTNNILPALLPLIQSFFGLSNNFFIAVGNIFLPIIDSLINGFNFLATNVFPVLAEVFTNTLSPAFQDLFNSVSELLTNIMPALNLLSLTVGGTLVGAIGVFIVALTGIFVVLAKLTQGIIAVISTFVKLTNIVIQFTANSIQSINNFVTQSIQFFNNLVSSVLKLFDNLVSGGEAKFNELSTNSQNQITQMSTSLGTIFTSLKDSVINIITQLVFDAIAKAAEFSSGMSEAFNGAVTSAVTAMQSLPSQILSILNNTASQALSGARSIGVNIGEGMAGGIRSKIKQVAKEAARMAENALRAAKSALGINSPSKKVRDQVAKNYILGYPAAFKKYGGNIMNSVKNFNKNILSTAKDTLSGSLNDVDLGNNRLSNIDIPNPNSMSNSLSRQSNTTNNNQKTITQNNNITVQSNQPNDIASDIMKHLNLITA